MIDHVKPPSWVTKRASCDATLLFEALGQIVERDVAEMNVVPANQRRHRTFIIEKNSDGVDPIIRVTAEGEEESVYFKRVSAGIYTNRPIGTAVVRWDVGENRCVLEWQGRKIHAWQFSQLILEPFFFPV